jgi:hypothetical protein
VPVRVSPADRVRHHIDELFAQDRPPVQSVMYGEVRPYPVYSQSWPPSSELAPTDQVYEPPFDEPPHT